MSYFTTTLPPRPPVRACIKLVTSSMSSVGVNVKTRSVPKSAVMASSIAQIVQVCRLRLLCTAG